MPVYEYACTVCGERTEAKQSFSAPPLEECPVCGGKLRKLYSPVGIVFKGSGFYSTDRNKAKESAAISKGEKASSGDGAARPDSKDKPKDKPSKAEVPAKSSEASAAARSTKEK